MPERRFSYHLNFRRTGERLNDLFSLNVVIPLLNYSITSALFAIPTIPIIYQVVSKEDFKT